MSSDIVSRVLQEQLIAKAMEHIDLTAMALELAPKIEKQMLKHIPAALNDEDYWWELLSSDNIKKKFSELIVTALKDNK